MDKREDEMIREIYEGRDIMLNTNNTADMVAMARLRGRRYVEGNWGDPTLTPKGIRYCETRLSGPWARIRAEITFDRAMLLVIAVATVTGVIVALGK